MIKSIPLNKLVPSPRNVRRGSDEQADLQLKADIAARGLLQNLVVAPARKPKGSFTVEAGARRLRALKALAEEGALDADHEVSCLVLGGAAAEAREVSLAENFQRLAMNPADECLAFGQLIEQGADVEGIARRFGVTVRFVEGRLRLSTLAPSVFEALGAGEISLEVAKAYAATPDQERQAWVFEQLQGSYSANHADSIRRMMTQATASATDRRALLVGEEAYVAAGGRIERDLFSDEAAEQWLDVQLLEELAAEKMETLAAEKAAELGLAWVRPTLEPWVGHALTSGLTRVIPEREPLTPEEAKRIEMAEADIDELAPILEDDEATPEARSEADEAIQALEAQIAALRDKPPILDEALKPRLGAFLLLDRNGVPTLDSVFYAEGPLEPDSATDEESGRPSVDGEDEGAPPVQASDKPKPLSRALIDELAIQRRDVLAVHVAADPDLAFDLAIFLMVERDAERHPAALELIFDLNEGDGLRAAFDAYRGAGYGLRSEIARVLRSMAPRDELAAWLEAWAHSDNTTDRHIAAEIGGWLPPDTATPWLDALRGDIEEEVAHCAGKASERRHCQAAVLEHLKQMEGSSKCRRWARLHAIFELADPNLLWRRDDPLSLGPFLEASPHEFFVEAERLKRKAESDLQSDIRREEQRERDGHA